MKIHFFPLFFKEQASKPCSDCRSRRELSIGLKNRSKDLNLTDLVKKKGRDYHFFSDTRYMPGKTPLLPLRITIRKKGSLKIPSFPTFFSMIPGALHDTKKIREAGADICRAGTLNEIVSA